MALSSATYGGGSASREQLTRAIVASAIGTTIEWYDFFLYGTAASLLIAQLYFPKQDPVVGQLAAFTTYFGGFLARPIGAAIFGHYGDRVGRKYTLIITLGLMGLATALIGLVPTYSSIGVAGGIILTILRFIQGIGVGGEWGGSVLLAVEWGGHKRRGLIGSAPQWGVPAGLVLAIGSEALMSVIAGPQGYLQWGWRIPFVASVVLLAVGIWIRLGILETPVFARLLEERRVEAQPLVEVWRLHWKEIVLTALIRTGQQAPFYIFTAFVLTYLTKTIKAATQTQALSWLLIASVISLFTVPFWGWLSDRAGRKRIYIIGAVVMALFSIPYFLLLDSKLPGLMMLAIALSLPVQDMQYGPLASFTAEAFTGRVRYTGASLGYQLASVTAGGPAPLIATWLLSFKLGSMPIAIYMILCAVISVVTAAILRERSRQDMAVEYDDEDSPEAGSSRDTAERAPATT
jgi:MFS family permease